jgi:hypothetical protein
LVVRPRCCAAVATCRCCSAGGVAADVAVMGYWLLHPYVIMVLISSVGGIRAIPKRDWGLRVTLASS